MTTLLRTPPPQAASPEPEHDGREPLAPPWSRRGWTVVCVAALALVAAVVAAVGPARGARSEYAWPPEALPTASPSEGWYAPLPLLNRVPSSIEARLPCDLAPPLAGGAPATVLATARSPTRAGALRVAVAGRELRITVGSHPIASLPWPASCPLRLEIRSGELRLPGRTVAFQTAALDDMPIVTGLFSGLDLRAGRPPQAVVRTRAYVTSPSARQIVAAVLAVALASAVFLMVALRPGSRPSRRVRRARQPWYGTGALVVGSLLVWWIVAPTFSDDGWLWVENRTLADIGGMAFYFDNWSVGVPLSPWLHWVRHLAVGSTSDLVLLRIPTLLALVACWPLCAWCLRRVVPAPVPRVAQWTLAAAFVVGAIAWGMTIRLEPFVSLLLLANLALMISFARSPRTAPLAAATVAAVLATTAHPTGVTSLAPLIAALPEIVRWLRRGGRSHLPALGALALAAAALAIVLLTLDSDLQTRLADARVVREGHRHGEPWWREFLRYARFDQYGGATAARRLSVALLVLPVLAWLTHRRGARTGILSLPSRTLAVGLLLLALVPSKWPWHFGALAAVGAVAAAAELARLVRERPGALASWIRPALALAAVAVATVWAWSAPGRQTPLDLQSTSWRDGLGDSPWLVAAPVLVIVAALAVERIRRRERAFPAAAGFSGVAGWTLALVSLGVVAVTVAALVLDAAREPWTPAGQNIEALSGRSGCGLADQVPLGDRAARHSLGALVGDPATATLLVPSVALYVPCASVPKVDGGLVEIPDLVVADSDAGPWPLYEPAGPFAAVRDLYSLRRIESGREELQVDRVDARVPGFARADATRRDL